MISLLLAAGGAPSADSHLFSLRTVYAANLAPAADATALCRGCSRSLSTPGQGALPQRPRPCGGECHARHLDEEREEPRHKAVASDAAGGPLTRSPPRRMLARVVRPHTG